MLFGKFRILGKLVLLVLVPLLGVVALSIPITVNRITAAQGAQSTSDAVQLAIRVSTAVQQLQLERLLSVGYRFGLVQASPLAVQGAKAVDAVAAVDDGGQPMTKALTQALRNASQLDTTRRNVLTRAVNPDVIVTDFTNVITPIVNGLGLSSSADLKTGVGRQLFALDQALRSDDLISQASSYLVAATVTKQTAMVGLFYSTLVQIQQALANSQTFFSDAQYKLYLGAQDAFTARVGTSFLVQAATDPNAAVRLLDIRTLFPSLQSVLVLGGFVEKRVAADVNATATANRNSALRDAFLVGAGSLLLLLIVIALSIIMARAVARPLRRLTVSADRIARAAESELERVADDEAEAIRPIRLDPVDVQARDEIGDLARAFDRVQTTAVRLVERQVVGRRNVAQMFGHVGRRTQNLVGRQLGLIDNLERKETDGDRLGDLYRLDHLSSRLRRNASSLVVLSGGAGENEHMAPLPLQDVVRLALGEIEDYTRVDVDVPESIEVGPAVLADLTLLLAELMENATSFSPPHTRVTVTANRQRGGARLTVRDHGLGLSPERMAEENARLTRRERLDLAPSEVLGLFVVGRLARRHGIEVTLTATAEGGVTVWVDLGPGHLVNAYGTGAPLLIPAFTDSGVPVSPAAVASVPMNHTAGFAQEVTGSSAIRSVRGSQQPFDANVLSRATRTLASGHSWNAFMPAPKVPAIEAAYTEGSVLPPSAYDVGVPVAGRVPAALPSAEAQAEPQAGPQDWPQAGPLPSPDDALAVRAAFDDFEAGISRAQTNGAEPEPPAPAPPSAAGHAPLARRVPGATLPRDEPHRPPPPAPAPALDPDAARALMEQFEYGVALALKETQPQPEGQPR